MQRGKTSLILVLQKRRKINDGEVAYDKQDDNVRDIAYHILILLTES